MSHPVAQIKEAECIGCTKCIQVCPVDAIIGSAKKMHTVLTDLCTGCENCIIACPVDCITLTPLSPAHTINWVERAQQAQYNTQKRTDRLQAIHLQKSKERSMATQQKNIKLEIQACINRKKLKITTQHEQTKT